MVPIEGWGVSVKAREEDEFRHTVDSPGTCTGGITSTVHDLGDAGASLWSLMSSDLYFCRLGPSAPMAKEEMDEALIDMWKLDLSQVEQ